jgi:hypothetical protein
MTDFFILNVEWVRVCTSNDDIIDNNYHVNIINNNIINNNIDNYTSKSNNKNIDNADNINNINNTDQTNNADNVDNILSNYINIITDNTNKHNKSNEYVYIKIQHNPLKFNKYAAFVKFIQPNKPNNYYKLLNKNLYYVNIDNEGYMFNDELSNIDIPIGTILPIKLYYFGSNTYEDIIEDLIKIDKMNNSTVSLSDIPSVRDKKCNIL